MPNFNKDFDFSRPHYFIYRSSITRNGTTYFAKDYGHKAFKIPIYK